MAAGPATYRRIPLERRIPALSTVPRDTVAEAGTEWVLEEVTIEWRPASLHLGLGRFLMRCAEQHAKVREWDAARMALEGEYEAADGEYLIKIRDALKPLRGLGQAYLEARGIPYQTALDRIHKAEGHVVLPRKNTDSVFSPEPQPSAPTSSWRPPSYAPSYDAEPAAKPEKQTHISREWVS